MTLARRILGYGAVLSWTLGACARFDATPLEPVVDAGGADGGGVDSTPEARPRDDGPSCDASLTIVSELISDGGDASAFGKCGGIVGGVQRGVGDDNCYWVPEAQPLTWEFANTRCQKPNPKDHLISIGSAEENEFVVSAFPSCADRWLGFYTDVTGRDVTAGDFKWKNTAPVTFTAWAPGFPNGVGACVVIRADGRWENRSCIEVHTVLCERE